MTSLSLQLNTAYCDRLRNSIQPQSRTWITRSKLKQPTLASHTTLRGQVLTKSTTRPRPYPLTRTLILSPHRPHILARDRLRVWIPWCARNQLDTDGTPINLAASDLERIREVLCEAWAVSTMEVYGSGLLTFHVFCDIRKLTERERVPARQVMIAAFISDLAGTYASSTIRNYVFGVRAWHVLHGVRWDMRLEEIESLLKAAKRLAPPSSKRKKRQPFTVDYITTLRCGLNLENDPLHAAVFACLTTTFYTAGRLGEFTVKALKGANSFSPEIHVKPTDVQVETDERGLKSTVFFIPRTKVAQSGEEISWSKQDGLTDPNAALQHHMTTNRPPPDGPLFAYRVNKKQMKPLTKAKFIEVIHAAADKAGLKHLQGHGIRIGSTLEYLLRGVPFDVMKVKGRWASDAFQTYLRKHAQILAPYMQA
ncbi:hypothetical protein FA13DRAFT_1906060 [Coprinellus micaceus]|uniref:DNA breaking-rejoining enzyme n=1 Tax=Coprinellus micaceus TaxID=71717 RepID=A0A4Y7SSL7_COPMI|nr:hypothetical protein FA13DRAFT_1906060 [Coprinellus micaceus]